MQPPDIWPAANLQLSEKCVYQCEALFGRLFIRGFISFFIFFILGLFLFGILAFAFSNVEVLGWLDQCGVPKAVSGYFPENKHATGHQKKAARYSSDLY